MTETASESSRQITINSDLDIIIARLRAREVARELGFNTVDQARISLAAGELARALSRNIEHHGEIIISGINTEGHRGIQVISVGATEGDQAPLKSTSEMHDNDMEFAKAMALLDEGFIDEENEQEKRVTLMKWLT